MIQQRELSGYEQQRKKNIEDNKKMLESLGLMRTVGYNYNFFEYDYSNYVLLLFVSCNAIECSGISKFDFSRKFIQLGFFISLF